MVQLRAAEAAAGSALSAISASSSAATVGAGRVAARAAKAFGEPVGQRQRLRFPASAGGLVSSWHRRQLNKGRRMTGHQSPSTRAQALT
jgi:hypothetical protein